MNNISAILPSIYAGLHNVSRELIGLIPAVQRDSTLERAAVGQSVMVPVVPAATGGNITPGSVPPDDGDVTLGNMNITISKSKYSPVRWNGEEQRAVGPSGQYNRVLSQQFAESFRWLANQVEVDGVIAAVQGASRAYGTPGTTPFGTAGDFTDFAGINRILDQNGAARGGRHLIAGSDARFNLEGKQSVLFKANEAGTDGLLRERTLTIVQGLGIGFSAAVGSIAKGTGSGYLVNNGAGYPIGTTVIVVDTGTGTINNGDVVTFAGDSNKYVIKSLVGTTLTLNSPGLRVAVADNTAITLGNSYVSNVAFTEDAMVMAARPPAAPEGGDSAIDMEMVTDPVSGITFEIRQYAEYRRMRWEVGLAWGFGVVNGEHIALLQG